MQYLIVEITFPVLVKRLKVQGRAWWTEILLKHVQRLQATEGNHITMAEVMERTVLLHDKSSRE